MTNTSKNSSSEQSKESRVLCDIYKGNKKEEMYLYVNKSDGLEKVPEALLSSFGELAQVTTLVLSKTRKRKMMKNLFLQKPIGFGMKYRPF